MLPLPTIEELNKLRKGIVFQSLIAEGGQKQVYKATMNGKDVVAKILLSKEPKAISRAEREIKCMGEITSPNFVKLIESFKGAIRDVQAIIIVEEFIEGETLQKIIEEGGYNNQELAMSVLETILGILTELDAKKIVHRDIKPLNIMVSSDKKITLLDLGVARIIDKDSITSSHAHMAPGTVPYSAPEQLVNDKGLQDVRTDLFSLGIVFFEVLTGKHPFNSDDEDVDYYEAIIGNQKANLLTFLPHTETNRALNKIYDTLTKNNSHARYRKPEFVIPDLNEAKRLIAEHA